MARKILKLYKVHASGHYFVVAENEQEAQLKYREAVRKVESADSCIELAEITTDDEAITDEEVWQAFRTAGEQETIEAEPEEIIEAPAETPEKLIERAVKRMNEKEKGEAWDLIRRFEMALKSRVK